MIAAILQPGYLPWLGFFEQMHRCGTFVLYDDVQYTKKDWRNRNRIKTKEGILWLTVPVFGKNHRALKIKDARIDNTQGWDQKHLRAIRYWYGSAPFFNHYFKELENIIGRGWDLLVDLDIALIEWISSLLGLTRRIIRSSDLDLPQAANRQERIVQVCKAVGADELYDGQSARDFVDTEYFFNHGIKVTFQEYRHPSYRQLWMKENGFIPNLSIIDLILNHGPESLSILTGVYMKMPLPFIPPP
ncbi:MAG: hypothetical protein COZ70_11010 [Deltaproteobacteria bacterium CG_4_8_14_3_um_filter_51_11]|nr:MAG: hypothetical protein COX16_06240 [Deltaproteobacteria bacterium CG23_combo_of_CG06-09_8_20_14_all_51_20]PIX19042.1 MAG: hypothetical protein COZ70_11010 [Deltaproteobacteria bacterium CG_4_8_14_3_um_filter_51_11]PIY24409.1 MAG: hypothetical protein COZ11_07610 [Deltaproteobacteria bacterium CG_4_10_14_3_um_filter_51_14]PJB37614.1 MAG: hypothetical protein CO107_04325 [Deltaproteobacteria bacterium CG_4_9_14_3_um_filter_51_14]